MMKIILRYCKSWGKNNTHFLEIESNTTFEVLKLKIAEKLDIVSKTFILKFKRDGFNVNSKKCDIKTLFSYLNKNDNVFESLHYKMKPIFAHSFENFYNKYESNPNSQNSH